MSDTATTTSSGGIGFAGLLTILFIGLKLGGVIDWPWIWVVSPVWISLGIGIICVVIFLVLLVTVAMIRASRKT